MIFRLKNKFLKIIYLSIFSIIYFLPINQIQSSTKNLGLINPSYLNKTNINSYILGPGDKLLIKFATCLDYLDASKIIDIDGYLDLLKIGKIYVSG